MNHRDFQILGLASSLRRASFHRGIVRVAHEWMSCEGFDLARIPYFNQDVEDKFDAETGDLVDQEARERLRRFLMALVEWSERFEHADAC